MIAFNQTSKIKQNNLIYIHPSTDQLYEPLRVALRKSTLSLSYLSTDKRSQYGQISPKGKKMRVLSPTEAENIKNGIFIPANKELVPTRNLQKVLGKSFTPVDFTQTVGEPLTPAQFNLKRQGGITEIVYEIKSQDPYQIYTSKKTYPQSPRPSKPMASSSFVGEQINKSNQVHEELPKPLFLSHSSKELIQGKQFNLSLANTPTESSNVSGSPPKVYNFRQSMRSQGEGSKISKDEYRYNLFSLVDDACNNSCHRGCCAENEIIAGKVAQKSWN